QVPIADSTLGVRLHQTGVNWRGYTVIFTRRHFGLCPRPSWLMSFSRLTSVVLDRNGRYSLSPGERPCDAYTTSSSPNTSNPFQNAKQLGPSVSIAGISNVGPTGPF